MISGGRLAVERPLPYQVICLQAEALAGLAVDAQIQVPQRNDLGRQGKFELTLALPFLGGLRLDVRL